MTEGIVRVKNASYARYEELLIRRDVIRKDTVLLDVILIYNN